MRLFRDKLHKDKKYKVLFIANAADLFPDPWWVDTDRKEFLNEGFEILEIDLKKYDRESLKKELDKADIIHFCGGSVFYLLSVIKQNGIDTIVQDYVKDEKIIYTGTSAGSIIASESNEIYKYDPEERTYSNLLHNYSGLGFVKFLIVPHCNNPEFVEANKAIIGQIPKYLDPLILLNDNQAVWVENDRFEILIG